MTLPPKLITILCFLQFFFVAAGFAVTCASLKIHDKVMPGMLGFLPPVPPLAIFVRAYGLWFLFVPAVWCIAAAARGRVTVGDATITLPQFVTGIVLTVALVVAFTLSALYAIHASFGPV